MDQLAILVCGGGQSGKTALVDELVQDAKLVDDNQLRAFDHGTPRLRAADRTIRGFFAGGERMCALFDAPASVESTRYVVMSATTANAAILVVDATRGLVAEGRRHAKLLSHFGIDRVAVVINKVDLVEAEQRFAELQRACQALAGEVGIGAITCLPASARERVNVMSRSRETSWYRGPCLIEWIDNVNLSPANKPLRLPVRRLDAPDSGTGGGGGEIVTGTARPGDRVRIQPSGRETRVSRVLTEAGALASARAGDSVFLAFADEIGAARGDLISTADAPAEVADRFEASVVFWLSDVALVQGRQYLFETTVTTASNVEILARVSSERLATNEPRACQLELDRAIPFDPYAENKHTGFFVLIDPATNRLVGAGTLDAALQRARHVHAQHLQVDKTARALLKQQRPVVIWLTGLPSSGKSTIANALETRLNSMGRHTYLLDGDNVRRGLNNDLGFTAADRVENIRRVAEVAKLMLDAGLIVICAFISPFRAERAMARRIVAEGEFIEVFVDTPPSIAEQRDPKGLYKRARRGEIKEFTGVDSPYEPPEMPEVRIETTITSPEAAADVILAAAHIARP
jgi:bifunctional enzyme CysN/CysC